MEKIANFTYYYYGASCCTVRWYEDSKGYITAKNEYGEVMYKGKEEYFGEFLDDLKIDKFA